MALPQQGTETLKLIETKLTKETSVNGLTPTGDGNPPFKPILRSPFSVNGLTPTGDGNFLEFFFLQSCQVLMALPQQGTETRDILYRRSDTFLLGVNGLTPTGDGNVRTITVEIFGMC